MGRDDETDREDDGETLVIFSFTIQCTSPIEALAPMRAFEIRPGMPRELDDVFYDVAYATFEDNSWQTRADKLDAAVNDALDRLDATGVDPGQMRRPDVFVRAFFTFGGGAETITADTVERLARYHAWIWIDT